MDALQQAQKSRVDALSGEHAPSAAVGSGLSSVPIVSPYTRADGCVTLQASCDAYLAAGSAAVTQSWLST